MYVCKHVHTCMYMYMHNIMCIHCRHLGKSAHNDKNMCLAHYSEERRVPSSQDVQKA